MTGRRGHHRRTSIGIAWIVALAGLVVGPVVPISAAPPPGTSDPDVQVVRGELVNVAGRSGPSAAARARSLTDRRATAPRAHPKAGLAADADTAGGAAVTLGTAGRRMPPPVAQGFGATSVHEYSEFSVGPQGATAATLGATILMASNTGLDAETMTTFLPSSPLDLVSTFDLPFDQYYWGAAVGSSEYRNRFIAVMPSFDDEAKSCAHGWLNIAVSTSADPGKPWVVFHVASTGTWTDRVSIGVSDDKVVIGDSEWNLDPGQPGCLGSTFEGSRIRVMDWADLLDAGTLTVREVSPAPRTSYYAWVPASNVPGTASTAAGSTVYLVGERDNGTWGHLEYASITGSAKAGTAHLVGNVDLSVADSVRLLVGPPATIAAFPTGNGFQDERVLTASWRAGRLWLSTNDSCRFDPDIVYRACARFMELDTTTSTPSVVDEATTGDVERDTFLPLVGLSRDGTAYFSMSASSAVTHAPIDEYATYRDTGQALSSGPDEAMFQPGPATFEGQDWGDVGSVVPDPAIAHQAWAIYPTTIADGGGVAAGAFETRLRGDLTGHPDGTFVMDSGNGWADQFFSVITLKPSVLSPIQWLRYSASPDVDWTASGPRLVHGVDVPSQGDPIPIDFAAPALGGPASGPVMNVYLQWRTEDGTWSRPVAGSARIDTVPPNFSGPTLAFGPGTVGGNAPVRIGWTASDDLSDLAWVHLDRQRISPSHADAIVNLPVGASSTIQQLTTGGRYLLYLQVSDQAGNLAGMDSGYFTIKSVQDSSSGLSYLKTWATQTSSSFLGGSTRYASAAGSRITYSFTGRAVGFVSTQAPNRGKAEVWVDGVKVATIDLHASTTRYRQIVWQASWATAGAHTVQIRVLGTPGRPRIDADAFVEF